MNDFDVSCATSIESMRCSSLTVPSVTDTRACVCPRVNSADPWVRGSTPTSQLMGRTVSRSRPSMRSPRVRTCSRIVVRSEEHTSELQSRLHLVCRLLLEKKKKENNQQRIRVLQRGEASPQRRTRWLVTRA